MMHCHCERSEAIHFAVILSVAKNPEILHFVQDDKDGLPRRFAPRNDGAVLR
jgi:hypothetical protein